MEHKEKGSNLFLVYMTVIMKVTDLKRSDKDLRQTTEKTSWLYGERQQIHCMHWYHQIHPSLAEDVYFPHCLSFNCLVKYLSGFP